MNYYPYFNGFPYQNIAPAAKTGILKGIFGNINFSSIVNGTQKTLGIVNQALPLIRQAKPVLNNAKTMFKVMNEFKKTDTSTTKEIVNNEIKSDINNPTTINTPTYQNNGPIFFQ